MGWVYYICNKANGKIYIGSTKSIVQERIRHHFDHLRKGTHVNPLLRSDFIEYGEHCFVWGICDSVNLRSSNIGPLKLCEQYFIHSLGALAPNGYNRKPWPAGKLYGNADCWFEHREQSYGPA